MNAISCSISSSVRPLRRRRRACRAPSNRPFRTSHQGESGAKIHGIKMIGGQIPANQHDAHETRGRHTLHGEWDSERPLCLPVQDTSEDTRSNKLTDDPAKIDVGGQVRSKSDGDHFGRVLDVSGASVHSCEWTHGCTEGLKDSPRDTSEQLTGEKSLDILGEKGDKDDCNHHDQLR
jgi:hypothetical protein